MNEYELDRMKRLGVLENFLANLTPETVEKIRLDLTRMPDSGYKRFALQAVDEIQNMKSA